MAGHKPWVDLSGREREQVGLMLVSLKEFSYGVDRMDEIWSPEQAGTARVRFYMNSLYQYCANYFMLSGPHKLRNVLSDLGSADLLMPIDQLLATPLGKSTLGEILKAFRNKFLTHQSFTFGPVEREVHDKFDVQKPENEARLHELIMELFRRTKVLYVELATRFPEGFGT